MSNYVLKYSRGEAVKYISHLDFVRMFHRVVRRSGLEMAFSTGFNPHPIMTVAMPLSVGVTADGEYIKMGFAKDYTEDKIKDTLNDNLPPGFEIVSVKQVQGKELDFAKLDQAEYVVEVELEHQCVPDLDAFLKNKALLVMKKSKSGVREADIRPYIYDLSLVKEDGVNLTFSIRLAAGNIYNLKPETVLDAMEKYIKDFKPAFSMVHRKSILAKGKIIL